MKAIRSGTAWEQYLDGQRSDHSMANKINELIENIRPTPVAGIGRPEPLRGGLAGFWSRRITGEQRLVHRVQGSGEAQRVEIAPCRYHY